jgi:hypothetical protein
VGNGYNDWYPPWQLTGDNVALHVDNFNSQTYNPLKSGQIRSSQDDSLKFVDGRLSTRKLQQQFEAGSSEDGRFSNDDNAQQQLRHHQRLGMKGKPVE